MKNYTLAEAKQKYMFAFDAIKLLKPAYDTAAEDLSQRESELRKASVVDLFLRYPSFRGIYVCVQSSAWEQSKGRLAGVYGFVLGDRPGDRFYDLSHGDHARGIEFAEVLVTEFNFAAAYAAAKKEVLYSGFKESNAVGKDINSYCFQELTSPVQDIVRQLLEGGWFNAENKWLQSLGIRGHDGFTSRAFEGIFLLEDFAK